MTRPNDRNLEKHEEGLIPVSDECRTDSSVCGDVGTGTCKKDCKRRPSP